MDALVLSKIQFAVTIFYHFLFVPLTIGLVIICAIIETKYFRTKNPLYLQMAEFWGKLFTINMVIGVVTGVTMEFQFGTNWSIYSKFMGDIFGSPLAIEALVAFFLESTFIGVWIFGRKKFSPKIRMISMWCVAVGTNLSALWIITANGFMQNPVGYEIVNGKAQMVDFGALVTNPYAWFMFFHTVVGCYICGSFFVMAVSAYNILRKKSIEMFKKSFKYGLVMATVASILTPIIGHQFGAYTAKVQPTKAAAIEAIWDSGENVSMPLILFTDGEGKPIIDAIKIPGLASFLYTNSFDGKIKGLTELDAENRAQIKAEQGVDLKEGEGIPPVAAVFYSFRIMVTLGIFFIFASLYGVYLWRTKKLEKTKWYLKLITWSVLLPYVAINLGWAVTEMGRQPFVVVGELLTSQAASPLHPAQVWFSLICLILFYMILIVADVYLMLKYIKKGPEKLEEGGAEHAA